VLNKLLTPIKLFIKFLFLTKNTEILLTDKNGIYDIILFSNYFIVIYLSFKLHILTKMIIRNYFSYICIHTYIRSGLGFSHGL
jgi:hypothetical protein